MKDMNFNAIAEYAHNMRNTMQKLVRGETNKEQYEGILLNLLENQKEDGAFTQVQDYRMDADCRIAYVYEPTYFGCCIIIYLDNLMHFSEDSKEAAALKKGLRFATGRSLNGAGYEQMSSRMMTMRAFEEAGIYKWFSDHGGTAPEFFDMWEELIANMKDSIATGRTFADWNVDYKKEMEERIERYEENYQAGGYVWYACYGSNINRDRFLEYVHACKDPKDPEGEKRFELPFSVYFAANSRRWENKGTAFLDLSKPGYALGKIYKVTRAQYEEIRKKEGANYTKKVFLGTYENLPVYTFTCNTSFDQRNIPSESYLDVIFHGLCETYPELDPTYLQEYLNGTIFTDLQYRVLDAIRKHPPYIKNREIADILELDAETVIGCVMELLDMKLIQKDRRCVDDATNEEAYFFTVEKERAFIDAQLAIKTHTTSGQAQGDTADDEKYKNLSLEDAPDTFTHLGIPRKKAAPLYEKGRRIYPRDPKVAINALAHADYRCEIDPENPTFVRKTSGKTYTEPHHLVPLSASDLFTVSLDVEENIVSLCSNCHNLLHYGRDAKQLLKRLYDERKAALERAGIFISFEQLLALYAIA